MKEHANRGILIAILVCLILIILGRTNEPYHYQDFPQSIETYSNSDTVFPFGDNKVIIYNSVGEMTVLQWDEETSTFEKIIDSYDYYWDE
ncbi:hypothetical protein JOC54_003147 [Alkalihalobacillus xiaoxiensis]|uniref:Uncharacterized protein n=1 Tax=Shouchella xiaoxiensis TaxID=766895 RepID=A0ABS2SWE9_9BACI|nr:hypothetical protein [Shouchella xiaoxiensis]MBM7839867.1 hypothetical protein [Shouchella xiaoxiensis]